MTTSIEKSSGGPILPDPVARRGISEAQWRTLTMSLYPGAAKESVLLVWDYCQARHLDPLKRPCHIVPMEVKLPTGAYEWRDVILPGIYELRTTAQRTGEYRGHPRPTYGPEVTIAGVTAPSWCEFEVRRGPRGHDPDLFPVRVLFAEVVATKAGGRANARWSKAPVQMLTKCAEAAALRAAFPDELGGEHTDDEMDGQPAPDRVVVADPAVAALVKPADFDEFVSLLQKAADDGIDEFAAAWKAAPPEHREYLTATDADAYDLLIQRARQHSGGDLFSAS
jgi:phage recombination protein Bet